MSGLKYIYRLNELASAPVPPGYVAVPVGEMGGREFEVVYDPRRFDVSIGVVWDELIEAAYEAAGWKLWARSGPDKRGVWARDRVAAARARLEPEQATPLGVDTTSVEVLRRLAGVCRRSAQQLADASDRKTLFTSAEVMTDIADVLAGDRVWDSVVGSYTPATSWHEFGVHSPEHGLGEGPEL